MPFTFDAYAQFLETIPDAAMVVNRTGTIMLANLQAETMFQYRPDELKNRSVQFLLPETKRAIHAGHIEGYFANPRMRPMGSGMELNGQRKDASEFPVDIMLRPIEIDRTLYALCVVRDITERKQNEAALKKAVEREMELARTDYLTGAANARHFYELVQGEIDRSSRYKRPFTIAYLDIDNFKTVNDLFGHSAGDKVLCTVVQCANSLLRKTDFVARLGGDEFVFLLTETGLEPARKTIANFHRNLLLEMQKNNWPVTFSIGVLTCNDTRQTVDELIKMADNLMYSVKNNSKNAVCYSVCTG